MAPNGKGTRQLASKESRKLGKGIAKVGNRIISSYKPEEISGWKIFFGNLVKSPKAAAQANIERKTLLGLYEAVKKEINKVNKGELKAYRGLEKQGLSQEELALAKSILKDPKYEKNLGKVAKEVEKNYMKSVAKTNAKALEGVPGWGGVAKGLINNKITKFGLIAGLPAYGIYKGLSGTPEENESEETPSQYRFDPNNGWQYYDPTSGQYVDQQEGFGVDRFGNTNFYDLDTGQWIGDYILGADGSIYDRSGNLIGNVAPNLLPGQNLFDLNLQKAAAILGKDQLSTNDIITLQKKFGLTTDGIVGARTLNAIAKAKADETGGKPNYFTTYQAT